MPTRPVPSLAAVLLAALAQVALDTRADAPPAPPPPAAYDVEVRYRIDAFRNERVAQFREMLSELEKLGFKRDPEDPAPADEASNPEADRLRGTVPSANARRLLGERHVRALRLIPAGAALPDAAKEVRVDLELSGGLAAASQVRLSDQARTVLASLKFREAVGYDDRGGTRLLGLLPAGQVETVLAGLRQQPAAKGLAAPLSSVTAVRVIEARPDLPPPAPRPAPPAVARGLEKVTTDLREALAADRGGPLRLEVILAAPPTDGDANWQRPLLRAAPGLAVEGILGPLVTVQATRAQVPALAALPGVAVVRLPRRAETAARGPGGADSLAAGDLERLHRLGYRGRGVRVAVVDADFRGWEALAGKGTPRRPHFLDLTRERNPSLEPDPTPPNAGVGAGTRIARATLEGAPEAELTLVRVDAAAPYQLLTVARAINGDRTTTPALERRAADLTGDRASLDLRRGELDAEREKVLADPGDEGPAGERRDAYRKRRAEFDRDEQDYNRRARLYLEYLRDVAALKGVRVVACGLVWGEGHPAGGSGALSRYFDDRPFHAALWLQAAGGRGASWSGPFADADGDGVMEFAPPGAPAPKGSWSPALNFLAWRGADGKETLDLPAGAVVRVAVQWREAHDPAFARSGEDPFRSPLAEFRLLVLRQLDPSGKKQPADDLAVAAESSGLPQRLAVTASSGTYEVTAQFRVPEAGRYAVRVEGRVPTDDRPASSPTLPGQRRGGEVRPRVVAVTLAGEGRALFRNYATAVGAVAVPADARGVLAVAPSPAAGVSGVGSGALPYEAGLVRKPDLLAPGPEPLGFAAGLAASAANAGFPPCGWPGVLGLSPGDVLRLPEHWPGQADGRGGR